jgi:hypothetical protein
MSADSASRNASSDRATGGPLRQYDDNGVDLSLVRANMKLRPEGRARRAERAWKARLRVQQIEGLATNVLVGDGP